jgi:hypothetical protein
MTLHHPEHDTDVASRLQRENDHLATALAKLEERMPSDEEVAYLRNAKEAAERSAWVVKLIRSNAPWLFVLLSAIGSGLYWLATHTISIDTKP